MIKKKAILALSIMAFVPIAKCIEYRTAAVLENITVERLPERTSERTWNKKTCFDPNVDDVPGKSDLVGADGWLLRGNALEKGIEGNCFR